MVGSERGWRPVPYVSAPAGITDLASSLSAVPFVGMAHIVPGVSVSEGADADVMRGEETLIFGLLAQTGVRDAVVCLPGTHSKWVRVRDARIDCFRTYMTGELRALLLQQGALATGVTQARSRDACLRGLRAGGAGLTGKLFQARARRLLGGLAAEHTSSFVSGVLIGDELAAERRRTESGVPVYLVARGEIAEDYRLAFDEAAVAHVVVDPEPLSALRLLRIAQQAGLVA